MGKLYHPGLPPNDDGNLSWTEPARYSQQGEVPLVPQLVSGLVGHPRHSRPSPTYAEVTAAMDCITGERGGSYCELPEGTPGPDDSLMNAAVESVGILANFTLRTGRPFFLGVGFHKCGTPTNPSFQLFCRLCVVVVRILRVDLLLRLLRVVSRVGLNSKLDDAQTVDNKRFGVLQAAHSVDYPHSILQRDD